ncbi:MAG: hypothetical protein JO356_03040 [Acidobacteria bacterium]|nr:hypothetical protein [Acidobacteriota bacterium]
MTEIPFPEYCRTVEQFLAAKYGIGVVTRDIPDPLTGDLDGREIHVDYSLGAEERLFLLAHLFGHTVQWNVNPQAFEIGRQVHPPVQEDLFPAILAYEEEAAEYGLFMLHETSVTSLDQWFSAYTACDQQYLLHYYRTGERRTFKTFWPTVVALIQPKPVPAFTPTRRSFRMDGVVI